MNGPRLSYNQAFEAPEQQRERLFAIARDAEPSADSATTAAIFTVLYALERNLRSDVPEEPELRSLQIENAEKFAGNCIRHILTTTMQPQPLPERTLRLVSL